MLDCLDILKKLESVECIKSHEGLWKVSLKPFHQFIIYLTLIIDWFCTCGIYVNSQGGPEFYDIVTYPNNVHDWYTSQPSPTTRGIVSNSNCNCIAGSSGDGERSRDRRGHSKRTPRPGWPSSPLRKYTRYFCYTHFLPTPPGTESGTHPRGSSRGHSWKQYLTNLPTFVGTLWIRFFVVCRALDLTAIGIVGLIWLVCSH